MNSVEKERVLPVIKEALREDIGDGDITTNSIVPENLTAEGIFLLKEEGVIAGFDVAKWVFEELGEVSFIPIIKEGEWIKPGKIAIIKGKARVLLTGERVALNFLQRLSGIATLTRRFVDRVKGTGVKILDTRKTTPGLRYLEKYAVRVGGGFNHRFGLFDAVLIKDNHIEIAGGVGNALKKVRGEIEVKNLDELREALDNGAERVLLDNMSIETLKKAVHIARGKAEVEVSGGVNLENVREIALTGCDYISVGMLTHSAKALDISLEITVK